MINVVELMWPVIIIWSLWLLYGPSFVVSMVRNWKIYVYKPTGREQIPNDKIIFEYVARSGKNTNGMAERLRNVHNICDDIGYKNYEVMLVTDNKEDDSMFWNIAKVITVPEDYKALPATYKARALQYAIEQIDVNENTWLYHLDEESRITKQTVQALFKFLNDGKNLVGAGPIFYTDKFEQVNRIVQMNESIRVSQCYTCAGQVNNRTPDWLHGSNILVESTVEKTVGWKYGPTIAEDQLFGLEVGKKYGNKFGWTGALVFEQPPLDFKSASAQRQRWAIGLMANLKFMTLKQKLSSYSRLIPWIIGCFGALIAIPFLITTIIYAPYEIISHIFTNVDWSNSWYWHLISRNPFQINSPVLSGLELLVDIYPKGDIIRYLHQPNAVEAVGGGAVLAVAFVTWLMYYYVGYIIHLKTLGYGKLRIIANCIIALPYIPIAAITETLPAFIAFTKVVMHKKVGWGKVTPK